MEPLFWPKNTDLPIRNLRLKLSQGQIFWREVGRGQTIVFLHGSWSDGNQWLPLMSKLSRNYHCVAPDLLGCGESSRLKKSAYSIELEVDCLAELFKGLRISSVYFVGHSLGAWVATRYALKYPAQVKGLMLMEPEGLDHPALQNRWRDYRRALNPLMGLWLRLSKPIMGYLGKKTEWLQARHRRRQLLSYAAACRLLFRRRRAAISAEQLNGSLADLTPPVLIWLPDYTTEIGQVLSQTYANTTDKAVLKKLSGDDDLIEQSPDLLAEEIKEFTQTIAKV